LLNAEISVLYIYISFKICSKNVGVHQDKIHIAGDFFSYRHMKVGSITMRRKILSRPTDKKLLEILKKRNRGKKIQKEKNYKDINETSIVVTLFDVFLYSRVMPYRR